MVYRPARPEFEVERRPLVMAVYGTRPEAIKLAPVVATLESSRLLRTMVVVTGQHREMLDQVNELFGIQPAHDLDAFAHGQSLTSITTKTLDRLTGVLEATEPDAVVVQGDTSSAFAAAVAAFYQKIPVFHVEAGLRTYDRWSPYPEEVNRRLITQLASLHLAPTPKSRDNLVRENVSRGDIVVTGNTVIDALMSVVRSPIAFERDDLAEAVAGDRRMVLITTHRRESWGQPMYAVGRAVARLARERRDVVFILPLHANPLVREALASATEGHPNVIATDPLPYGQFAQLMKRATIVLTDSGGIQEEAPSLSRPVLVLRNDSERPEAIEAGTARLVGTDESVVYSAVSELLDDSDMYARMANAVNPYGDGRAAIRCVAAMEHFFGVGERLPEFGG